uniref:Arrestin C-terminal-like domain-containing protein n=1 Tax=Acrobeloides nanus TaxID=290746 RepID=A0A914E584_9BILA
MWNMPISCLTMAEMPTVALNVVFAENRIFTGEFLKGTVLLDSADPGTVVQEFFAEIKGMGKSGWVNVHTDKIYETEKEYLNSLVPLGHSGTMIRPGRHQFPFQVLIPESAPSSYESQFGTIRYAVKISLLTNSDQSTTSETFPFHVIARSYFEDVPLALMKQIEYKDEVDFTVCTFPFGTVYLRVTLPRTGFRLGELIQVKVHVRSCTRKALKDCRMQLILKSQFEAMSRYEHVNEKKLLEQMLDNVLLGRAKGRSETEFKTCDLKIPENGVPSQQSTRGDGDVNIIAISYVLRFVAKPGIETEIPIIVTSKGYREPTKSITSSAVAELRPARSNRRATIFESNDPNNPAVFYC